MKQNFFGMQSIDEKITKILKPIFIGNKKEFIMINNLVKNWPEIVGKKYCEFCYPKSINFTKSKDLNSSYGKLTIGVYNPAIGFFLDNNSELILERIASFYGFKSISKIIIKQEPKHIKSKSKEIILSKKDEENLEQKISNINDEELVKTLRELGKDVLFNGKKPNTTYEK